MLKFVRKFSANPAVILPLVGMFAFVSCKKDELGARAINDLQNQQKTSFAQNMRTTDRSPETLFRGILFLDGDFASNIDALTPMVERRDAAPDSIKQFHKLFADEILDSIKLRSASILTDFKKDVQSTDLYVVDNALKKAVMLVNEIAKNSPNYKGYFAVAEEVRKEVNVNDYNLETADGLKKFQETLRTKATDKLRPGGGGGSTGSKIIIPIFVVYFFVWESVFIVNEIAILTFIFAVWALFFVVDAKVSGDGNNLTTEQLTKQISDAARSTN